jgi:hypothetical protein
VSATAEHRVSVVVDATGRGRIHLDGADVSGLVSGVHIDAGVGLVTTVELELRLAVSAELNGARVIVGLDSEIEELLVALGWTPPAGDR